MVLATGRITGVEAPLRWRHPERGLASPGDYVTLAEEAGSIIPSWRRVLHEGRRQTRASLSGLTTIQMP